MSFDVFLAQVEVLRIGRDGDTHTLGLGLSQQPETARSVGVNDLEPYTGVPLEFEQDGDSGTPNDIARVDTAERVDVSWRARRRRLLIEVFEERLCKGMNHTRQTGVGDGLEGLVELTGIVECQPRIVGVAASDLEDLEAGHAGLGKALDLIELDRPDEVAPVDEAVLCGDGTLLLEQFNGGCRRLHVGHVDVGRVSTHGGGPR